jgi:hypothetical protein
MQYRALDAHELTNAEEMQIYLCGVKSLHTAVQGQYTHVLVMQQKKKKK